ncbi:MAG: hypothetical protein Q8K00_01090 [Syntrophales bacterium]|nr:hypothetical protein [Syntrophales bacterium]
MAGITFNQTTKEFEIKGPESFIESNFHKIEDILKESLGTMKKKVSGKTTANREIQLSDEIQKPQTAPIMKASEGSAPETPAATKPGVQKISEAAKATRPPVRKYFNTLGKPIRSEDTSIGKDQAAGLIGRTPEGISITSLKEKFGLSQHQIEGIIKDAEKHGRVRKYLNGSYVWV